MQRHSLQIHNSTNVYNSFVCNLTMRYPRTFRCLSNPYPGTLGFSGVNAAGEKCAGVPREISRRGMQVSRCHGNTRRERLWLPVTLPTRWLGKKRRECTAMMKKRGRWWLLLKRRIGHSIEFLPGAVLAPLACHLIGRTAACVEHIGKAIRNTAENNVVSTSTIVSRYFR